MYLIGLAFETKRLPPLELSTIHGFSFSVSSYHAKLVLARCMQNNSSGVSLSVCMVPS